MSLNYKVIQPLGEGSFGKAFLCKRESDDSLCVIKQILIEGMDKKEKDDVLNESIILAKLDHQNIIKFFEVFESKKPKQMINIVTEYADGGDLSEKIKERKNKNNYFTESEILDYFTQICLAIKHIHENKIIHRDLKSGNIFLMKNGLVKLGDFGIAKKFQKTTDKAKTFIGTPYYLSPEIIDGKPYDSKSDIWSLGVLLYEMMTFKMPFNANSLPMLSVKITRGQYTPPPTIYTKDLRELVTKCLTIDPKIRPSIHEILRMPIIQNRIRSFLTEVQYNKEFNRTITKKYKEKTIIKTKEVKGLNVEVFEPSVISGNPISNLNIKKSNNNDKNNQKIVDYFKQRNLKKEKDEKEKDRKKQDFQDFLKETKKSKKWGGIGQNQYNESGVMWGRNQENQRPILFKEEDNKTEDINLNDLMNSYDDTNKITEDQYNKARLLDMLDNIVNEEKSNNENEEVNDIVNHQYQNKTNKTNKTIKEENEQEIDEECCSEFINIELIRIELEKSLGLNLFKTVYHFICYESYNKDINCDDDEIKKKIKEELKNKGFNEKEIDLTSQKLNQIISLILKEKSIEQQS